MKIIQYRIARWILNRYLKKNPQMAVPLEIELEQFAKEHFSLSEYQGMRTAWVLQCGRYSEFHSSNDRDDGRR